MTDVNTTLTPKQQRMVAAAAGAASEAPAATGGDATPANPGSEPAAPETPTEPTAKVEITDTFVVAGRINVRGDGATQARYNLLVMNQDAKNMLDLLGSFDPDRAFEAANDQGDYYVIVTMDARSLGRLRNGAKGNPAALIEGELTIVDAQNGRPTGHLVVKAAQPVSFLNGGQARQRTANTDRAATAPVSAIRGGLLGGLGRR